MSILIKGMNLPKEEVAVIIYSDGEVRTEGWEKYSAVEVPEHGRLIDADALIEDLERQCKEVFRIDAVSPDDYWITRNEAYNEALWKTWVESFNNYLKTRPTVIPADKDGEE